MPDLNAPSHHLARLLDSQYGELLERWTTRAAARRGVLPELGAHLPALLRGLIDELGVPEREDRQSSPGAKLPGIFSSSFDLESVVYEYGLLQRIVLELLEKASVPVSMRDVRRLGDWFTRAVAAAAVEHARVGDTSNERVPSEVFDTQRSGQETRRSGRQTPPKVVGTGTFDQALLMQAPVALSVMRGPDFVYEFANPLALSMAGRHDVVGKSVRQAFPELEPGAPVFQLLTHVYASGEAYSTDEYRVPIDRTGDGSIEDVYFKFTCQPIRDEQGAVEAILTVAVDISPQVQARQRIEALLAELRLSDQRKDELLAMLGHELRNPIAAISTALTLLDQVEGDAIKSARYRETARRQMSHLVRLVDDLLDVARLTRGQVELRREDLDFGAIVQHALSATRPLIESRSHELSVTLTSGAFRVFADATRLEQVVVNLLTNAAIYTEPGGSIRVRLARDEDAPVPSAVLSVEDTGRGIPADMLVRIFELFTQVSPGIDRSIGGLGIGLTLVKHLVEMHGGSVSAASEGAGRGSEFTIRLPLQIDTPVAAPPPRPLTPNAQRRRVVLVEDSDDVRELLAECIVQLGHEVSVAEDGLEGAMAIARAKPDIALIDVGLPGIDGYEVARRVRAEPTGHDVYLVALTGYGGEDTARAAREAGFDQHVTKPIDIDQLRVILARELGEGR